MKEICDRDDGRAAGLCRLAFALEDREEERQESARNVRERCGREI
jgi:hypothetical protein